MQIALLFLLNMCWRASNYFLGFAYHCYRECLPGAAHVPQNSKNASGFPNPPIPRVAELFFLSDARVMKTIKGV
jgi:hypothetical protein